MDARPEVSVSIVAYNSADHIRECLDSLTEYINSSIAEVIVVDNASPDAVARLVEKEYPQIRLLRSEFNRYFAGGHNLAWPHIHGRYWMLLNPDAVLTPGSLKRLVKWMDEHPKVGIASPDLVNRKGQSQRAAARRELSISLSLIELLRLHKLLPAKFTEQLFLGAYWSGSAHLNVDWVPGAAMIARRNAIADAGLLNEKLPMFAEDSEWCRRVRAKGWNIGVAPVKVIHEEGQSTLKSFQPEERVFRIWRGVYASIEAEHNRVYVQVLWAINTVAAAIEAYHPRRTVASRRANAMRLRAHLRIPIRPLGSRELSSSLNESASAMDPQRRQQNTCPLCGSTTLVYRTVARDRWYRLPGMFTVVECGVCRSWLLTDAPSDVSGYYPDSYYSYERDEAINNSVSDNSSSSVKPSVLTRACQALKRLVLKVPRARHVVDRIAPRRVGVDERLAAGDSSGQVVLDVGCGAGQMLDLYRRFGWATWGCEMSTLGVMRARKAGHQMMEGSFLECRFVPGTFDLVRFSHVIEHLPMPVAAIRRASELLRPGGLCYIEIPNVAGWLSRVSGPYYYGIEAPRHLVIPHPDKLREVLEENGLRVVHRSTRSLGFGIAATLLCFLRRRSLSEERGWRLADGPARVFTLLQGLGDVVAPIGDAFGKGDMIRFVARKEGNVGALDLDRDPVLTTLPPRYARTSDMSRL